ncbi:PREDICTED: uncharacterized protein LOC18507232 isoform X2 [Theobroma cacao]|uniref:Uncharacterized protein LOC18507232 isoform X2 n=1 Tax=Theobroma cacao TaxID=3641 RepID=A0AB32WQI6_THECC|nr:PREDICTED: uncharacterized protein LOC18507232 isoform X2 [Theobroma cacao]
MRLRTFSMRRRVARMVLRKSRFNIRYKHKKNGTKDLKVKYGRLKADIEEIGKEQKSIKEGQSQVREKFKAIEMECQMLKKETELIIQRSALTRLRLALLFHILKAREEGDFAKAAQLTQLLRELISRDNIQ